MRYISVKELLDFFGGLSICKQDYWKTIINIFIKLSWKKVLEWIRITDAKINYFYHGKWAK